MYRVTVNLEPVPLNFYAPLALSRNVVDTTWERVLKQSLIRRKEKESARRGGGGGGALLVYRGRITGDFRIYHQGKDGPGALPRKIFDV